MKEIFLIIKMNFIEDYLLYGWSINKFKIKKSEKIISSRDYKIYRIENIFKSKKLKEDCEKRLGKFLDIYA